jgi:hypothetical protein
MRRTAAFYLGPLVAVGLGSLLLTLHGCQEATDTQPVDFATTTANKQLLIYGDGLGSGTVTVPPTAGRATLTCVITLGVAAANCNRFYPTGTVLTLTATPASGHTFLRWTDACNGSGACAITMSQTQKVTATFAPPANSAPLGIGGGGSGNGSVVADSPPGGINCTLTAGAVSATGCAALYPLGTAVRLTATPASGHSFAGWAGDCAAAGTTPQCDLTMAKALRATAVFALPGVPAPEAQMGKWDPAFTTPVVPIHLSLLSNGNVLLWGHTGDPWLWSPSAYPGDPTAGFTLAGTPTEEFCSGHASLPDGRLLVVGGHDNAKGNGFGLSDVNLFNGTSWQTMPAMAEGRWYPTATTMPNGEIAVVAGTDNNNLPVKIPEVWTGSAWRKLTTAPFSLPYYPRMFVAPNGKLFYAGEGPVTKYLATSGTGAWSNVGSRIVADRNYGSAVMLDGKVLYAGGGGKVLGCTTPVEQSAELIDLQAASPQWRAVGSMAFRRRQLNLTILADGTVLASGGSSACGFSNEAGSVYPAEVWNPVTEQWSSLASMHVSRVYHSSAILLPDGRVLSGGGGDNGEGTSQFNAEVFTPRYLFASDGTPAPRPTYSLPSTQLSYGQAVTVESPQASTIAKVTLIRLSAVTHAFNQNQRLNTLSFTLDPSGTSLRVTTPSGANLAPPGAYMLFLVNASGVPSVAQIVTLQ